MKTSVRLFAVFALLVEVSSAFLNGADKLHMKSGRVYEGRIVAESDVEVKILLANGITFGFGPQLIDHIEREPVEAAPNTLPDTATMLAAAQAIAPQDWVQIPATLIDEGVLRNVPYQSYRSGVLELNIYGDPAAPAGVEVGIYGASTALPFKKRLVAFVSEVTGAEFPESFNLNEDKKRLGLIDYEVTPPTAPDAYGGWWISAYDMSRLESARVADNEINTITTQRAEITSKTKADESKERQEAMSATRQKSDEWTSDDLARAIRPTQTQPSYASSGYAAYSSGRVWVKSYVRKDGTFVRGYSRRR